MAFRCLIVVRGGRFGSSSRAALRIRSGVSHFASSSGMRKDIFAPLYAPFSSLALGRTYIVRAGEATRSPKILRKNSQIPPLRSEATCSTRRRLPQERRSSSAQLVTWIRAAVPLGTLSPKAARKNFCEFLLISSALALGNLEKSACPQSIRTPSSLIPLESISSSSC